MRKNMQNNNLKKSHIIAIGFLLIFGGFWFGTKNYFGTLRDEIFQEKNMSLFEQEEPEEVVEVKEEAPTKTVENIPVAPEVSIPKQANSSKNTFIGILEIPKIKLKRGFVDINSSQNKISKNITVIESSSYPDVPKGNLILAGHSGRGYIAFFKNLYQLSKGDLAYVTYGGVKYIYQIVNIYDQEKTGTAKIYRDSSKSTLTLITCTKDSDTKQTIYIAELIDKK